MQRLEVVLGRVHLGGRRRAPAPARSRWCPPSSPTRRRRARGSRRRSRAAPRGDRPGTGRRRSRRRRRPPRSRRRARRSGGRPAAGWRRRTGGGCARSGRSRAAPPRRPAGRRARRAAGMSDERRHESAISGRTPATIVPSAWKASHSDLNATSVTAGRVDMTRRLHPLLLVESAAAKDYRLVDRRAGVSPTSTVRRTGADPLQCAHDAPMDLSHTVTIAAGDTVAEFVPGGEHGVRLAARRRARSCSTPATGCRRTRRLARRWGSRCCTRGPTGSSHRGYEAAGRHVTLPDPDGRYPLDPGGLPIHGALPGDLVWEVPRSPVPTASTRA